MCNNIYLPANAHFFPMSVMIPTYVTASLVINNFQQAALTGKWYKEDLWEL